MIRTGRRRITVFKFLVLRLHMHKTTFLAHLHSLWKCLHPGVSCCRCLLLLSPLLKPALWSSLPQSSGDGSTNRRALTEALDSTMPYNQRDALPQKTCKLRPRCTPRHVSSSTTNARLATLWLSWSSAYVGERCGGLPGWTE